MRRSLLPQAPPSPDPDAEPASWSAVATVRTVNIIFCGCSTRDARSGRTPRRLRSRGWPAFRQPSCPSVWPPGPESLLQNEGHRILGQDGPIR